jgi:N-acetyl-gamma-glutamyl-phosphate reductase
VVDEAPATKWASGSNAAFVSVRIDPRTRNLVALGALDNLGKGAAGQAIQAANVALGFPEHSGLSTIGVYP